MYVKQLEISGFKSFAERTRLEFAPGINAVVGPNGCGKSNIIDAVRWVLGEQKYSKIRSKSMDEVVFVGTKKRNPAGMSSVTLTFDNSDGMIPMDTPTVALTRQVFREGTGRFLINNKNVRLKDVHELIADTGIGAGALFVLSNQEIDRILSRDSQERRAILEETAGINKYQIRKKETLKKLENTRENVTRLNDILKEVERQLESSARQLKRLEKYRKIKIKLSRLEISILLLDIENLTEKQGEIQEKIDKLEDHRSLLSRKIEDVRFHISTLESERSRCNLETEKAKEGFNRISLDQEKIRGNCDLIQEKIRQARGSLCEYENNRDRLKERIEKLRARVEENLSELEETKKSRDDLQAEYEKFLVDFSHREEKYRQKLHDLKNQKDELSVLIRKKEMLELSLDHSRSILQSALDEQKGLKEKSKNLKCEIDESLEKLSLWDHKLEDLELQKRETGGEIERLSLSRQQLQKDQQDRYAKFQDLKEEIRSARSELSILIREEEDFRGFSGAFKQIMQSRESLPELIPVYTVIKVDPQYDTAMDVALGAHFQSIITGSRREADKRISYLKKEKAGRLTFFPLDMDRKGQDTPSLPRGLPGIIGWAKDLIETDPRYRDIIQIICGKTLILKDLPSAYNVYDHQKRTGGFIPRMVTLEGDVVEFSGAVTGGRYRVDRSQILSRTRRREELEANLEGRVTHAQKIEERLKIINRELGEIDEKMEPMTRKTRELDREHQDISGQLKLFESMVERAKEDLANRNLSEEKMEERIENARKNLRDLEDEMESVTGELARKNEALRISEEADCAEIGDIKSLAEQKSHMKSGIEEFESRIRMLKSGIEQDQSYLEENRRDFERILEDFAKRESYVREQENLLQETLNQESILKLKSKSLRLALDSSLENLEKVEKAMEQGRLELLEIEDERAKNDHGINTLSLERIEQTSKLAYKTERLGEFPADLRDSIRGTSRPRSEVYEEMEATRKYLAGFDDVNFSAEEEYKEHKERFDYLAGQIEDLNEAGRGLKSIIKEMDSVSLSSLEETLKILNERFNGLFQKVFKGGTARVFFSDPENRLESGVDVEVQPPGKRTTNMNLLSTGEKSLTAVTFLFALLSIRPGPFVLLDELDAPLDESNVEKIAGLIREFAVRSQFMVVTHNKKTMEYADTMIGITMEEPGVSKIVSVKFEDIDSFTGKKVPAGSA